MLPGRSGVLASQGRVIQPTKAVAAEREGTYGRSAHSWQAQRDAVAAEKDATDTVVWALSHAEKLVVKTLKKQRRSLLECESSSALTARLANTSCSSILTSRTSVGGSPSSARLGGHLATSGSLEVETGAKT